jgi:hypothetical protein
MLCHTGTESRLCPVLDLRGNFNSLLQFLDSSVTSWRMNYMQRFLLERGEHLIVVCLEDTHLNAASDTFLTQLTNPLFRYRGRFFA